MNSPYRTACPPSPPRTSPWRRAGTSLAVLLTLAVLSHHAFGDARYAVLIVLASLLAMVALVVVLTIVFIACAMAFVVFWLLWS